MINTIFFLLYYIWSPSESTIVKKEELLLLCKHLTWNNDRCWKVGFMLFSSGILNINFAEKIESGLRNHQLWDGSWLFSLIICLTVCSFLSPILHVHVFNWLNSSTGNFVKCCIFGNVLTEIASKNKKKTCKNCKKGFFFSQIVWEKCYSCKIPFTVQNRGFFAPLSCWLSFLLRPFQMHLYHWD